MRLIEGLEATGIEPGFYKSLEDVLPQKMITVVTRCFQGGGAEEVKAWLNKYGITVDDVLAYKPPAIVYIDERALKFDVTTKDLLVK